MPLTCDALHELLISRAQCDVSESGLRIATQCLYPSADVVFVHVASLGDGFVVSDAGGVSRNVFNHGRDETALNAGLAAAGDRHCLRVEGGALFADVPSVDWLPAAVTAIANGASYAAAVALEHLARKTETGLLTKIFEQLVSVIPERHIARSYECRGKSGKSWKIDFAILARSERPVLIKAVTPHHNSVSANYTAFGDIGDLSAERFCAFQRNLAPEDAALLRQVASLVPVKSVGGGAKAVLEAYH